MEKDIITLFNSLTNKLKTEGSKFSTSSVWNYCLLFRDDNVDFYHQSEDILAKAFSDLYTIRRGSEKELISLIAKKMNVPIQGNEQNIWNTFQNNFIKNGYAYHVTNGEGANSIKKYGLNVYEKGEIGEKLRDVCESIKDKELLKSFFGKGSVDKDRFYYSHILNVGGSSYGNAPEWFSFLIRRDSNEVGTPEFSQTKESVIKNVMMMMKESEESEQTQKLMIELIEASWEKYLKNVKKVAVIIPNSELGFLPADIDIKRDSKLDNATEGLELVLGIAIDRLLNGMDVYSDKIIPPEKLMFLDVMNNELSQGQYKIVNPIEAEVQKKKIQKRKEELLNRKLDFEVRPQPENSEGREMIDYMLFSLCDGFGYYWKKLEGRGGIDDLLKQDDEISSDAKQYNSNLHGVNHTRRVNFFANIIMMELGDAISERDKELVFAIIKNHDIGRRNDSADYSHGRNSARMLEENPQRLKGFSAEEQEIIKFAISEHCYSKEENEEDLANFIFNQNSIPENASKEDQKKYERVRQILHIIEDADRLDRVRLDPKGEYKSEGLDKSYLNLNVSKTLEKLAYESYNSVLEMMYLEKEGRKLDRIYPHKEIKLFDETAPTLE